MNRLLQINSSIFGQAGESTKLANRFVELWKAMDPAREVVVRELGHGPIPHLDGERFSAFMTPPDKRTAEQQAVIDFSDNLIAELRAVDIIVIGTPLYNFSIPSGLKAYLDHVARVGETFRYTEQGPIGLLPGKRVVVVTARGGVYAPQDDLVAAYMAEFWGLFGITDIDSICVEGLNISPERRALGFADAEEQLQRTLMKFASPLLEEDAKASRKSAGKR